MPVVKSKRTYKEPDPLEKLYTAIPENLLELTKAGICTWRYEGCTLFSHSILRDSDLYVCHFSTVYDPNIRIQADRIRLLVSDEDCMLIVRENLISNSEVCRLKNYIENTPNVKIMSAVRSLMSINDSLIKLHPKYKKYIEKEGF